MRIYRTSKQLEQKCGDFVTIKLTPNELIDAYFEQKKMFTISDIEEAIRERIERSGSHLYFPEDYPTRLAESTAHAFERIVDNNDLYNELYAGMLEYHIDEILEKDGYDPYTLLKENEDGK